MGGPREPVHRKVQIGPDLTRAATPWPNLQCNTQRRAASSLIVGLVAGEERVLEDEEPLIVSNVLQSVGRYL